MPPLHGCNAAADAGRGRGMAALECKAVGVVAEKRLVMVIRGVLLASQRSGIV